MAARITSFISFSAIMAAIAPAYAQQVQTLEPVAQDAAQEPVFSITPRVTYTWTNLNVPNTSSSEQVARSTFQAPSAGLTVELRPRGSRFQYSLTGVYGEGDGGLYGTNSGLDIGGTYKAKRLDAEGIVRFYPSDLPAYLMVGARYIRFEVEDRLGGNVVFSTTNSNVGNETIDAGALEIGGGVNGPLSDSLSYFSNAIVGYGALKAESDTGSHITGGGSDRQYGPMGDMSVGLTYSPVGRDGQGRTTASRWSASTRYRATIFPVHYAPDTSSYDFWVTHGLEVNLSLRF